MSGDMCRPEEYECCSRQSQDDAPGCPLLALGRRDEQNPGSEAAHAAGHEHEPAQGLTHIEFRHFVEALDQLFGVLPLCLGQMAMKLPWKSMTDDQLVACCRQRPCEAAWETFGGRFGCHVLAGAFVAWFAYATRPVPWYGYFGLACIYLIAAAIAYIFVFLLPACARAIPYAGELDRRHCLLSFPREVRKARRLLEGADPPDWIILVHSEGMGPWMWTRLTLFESPPRGVWERRSGSRFGTIRDPQHDPRDWLVRQDRTLGEEECRSTLAALRMIDLNDVVDVKCDAFDTEYSWLAVLRRDPPLTRKAKFCPEGVLFDPGSRELPTFRLASLIIKLPEELAT
jgi:hypothetical protein